MTSLKPITIVGGGLAGLTLGVALRQRGIPVAIIEAGRYPRHRVCGEFISGRGQSVLERLGLRKAISELGAKPASDVAFFSESTTTGVLPLPIPAVCCSRHALDARLAIEFERLGGHLVQAQRLREPIAGEGVVRATGRRLRSETGGWRWFGLKVHARQVALDADLELHFMRNGYVGLCRLNHGETNICGFFRSRSPLRNLDRPWPDQFRGPPGSALQARLAEAAFNHSSFCAIAGLDPRGRSIDSATECSIGDALGMIAPMTGNGMSMAFESAELAVEPLSRYCRHAMDWAHARGELADACRRRFRSRRRVAAWLHALMFSEKLCSAMIALGKGAPRLLDFFFFHTR